MIQKQNIFLQILVWKLNFSLKLQSHQKSFCKNLFEHLVSAYHCSHSENLIMLILWDLGTSD